MRGLPKCIGGRCIRTCGQGAMTARRESRRLPPPAPQRPVGGDDHDLVATHAPEADLLDDRVVARARSVHGVDRVGLTTRPATLGGALQDQHDHVVAEVSLRDRLVQSLGRTGSVTPPAVRPAADHVGAVDDQHAHAASVGLW